MIAPGSTRVSAGDKRVYTDEKAVYEMKKDVALFAECQYNLINYKKSGEPFMNLVTIVPV